MACTGRRSFIAATLKTLWLSRIPLGYDWLLGHLIISKEARKQGSASYCNSGELELEISSAQNVGLDPANV